MTRLILIRYTEPSPLLTPLTPKRIPSPQQDQAVEEPELGTPQDPLISIEDRSSDSGLPYAGFSHCWVRHPQKMYN